MARPNRVAIPQGTYHIVTRVAHDMPLLADVALKRKIETWIYGIAGFGGIDVLDWNIQDSSLHLLLRVQQIPRRLWKNAGTVPVPENFTLRHSECRPTRWMREERQMVNDGEKDGDRPRQSVSVESLPEEMCNRPETGFSMSDEEMVARLRLLYAGCSDTARLLEKKWERLRRKGRDGEVDEEKDRFCRRMYNVSRFMQTLKQRISEGVNRMGHAGVLWQGRFRSSVVDASHDAMTLAAFRIECRSRTEGKAKHSVQNGFSAFAAACGDGANAEAARHGFEIVCSCTWDEAQRRLTAKFAERLPATYDPEKSATHYPVYDGKKTRWVPLTVWQFALTKSEVFERDGYVARKSEFRRRVLDQMTDGFPAPGGSSLKTLEALRWTALAA